MRRAGLTLDLKMTAHSSFTTRHLEEQDERCSLTMREGASVSADVVERRHVADDRRPDWEYQTREQSAPRARHHSARPRVTRTIRERWTAAPRIAASR
jgi:hypothetical protein